VKIKTYILYTVTSSKNRAVYEMWKNIVQPDSPHMTGICALHAG